MMRAVKLVTSGPALVNLRTSRVAVVVYTLFCRLFYRQLVSNSLIAGFETIKVSPPYLKPLCEVAREVLTLVVPQLDQE